MTAFARSADRAAPIPRSRMLGYSLGSMGAVAFVTLPGLVLLIYLTDMLNVPAYLAGIVVGVPKFWDVIFAPFVGAISDREAVRTGRRRKLMAIGALTLPLPFVLTFSSPFSGGAAAAWVMVMFFIAATMFVLFEVPYASLATEMSSDPAQRSRAVAWRVAGMTIGILIAGGSAAAVVVAAGGGKHGYLVMGAVFAVLICLLMLLATFSTRWIESRPGHEVLGIVESFRMARGNKPFLAILTAFVLQSMGLAIYLAAINYVAVYYLGGMARVSLLFMCTIAPSLIAVPLWTWVGSRLGKHNAYVLVSLLYAACCAMMYPLIRSVAVAPGETPHMLPVLVAAVLVGLCFGGQQVLPMAMVPDTIIADARRTGQVQAGCFNGTWTAFASAAYATGPMVFSFILGATGYLSSSSLHKPVAQSASALNGILFGMSFVPASLMLASIPFIIRYGRSTAARLSDARAPAKAGAVV